MQDAMLSDLGSTRASSLDMAGLLALVADALTTTDRAFPAQMTSLAT